MAPETAWEKLQGLGFRLVAIADHLDEDYREARAADALHDLHVNAALILARNACQLDIERHLRVAIERDRREDRAYGRAPRHAGWIRQAGCALARFADRLIVRQAGAAVEALATASLGAGRQNDEGRP
jgi:hypothetical protein